MSARDTAHRIFSYLQDCLVDRVPISIEKMGEIIDTDARSQNAELRAALKISPDDVGRIMHKTWTETKRSQGFVGPFDICPETNLPHNARFHSEHKCKFHADLIPWEDLPEKQKDFNRHAFDAVLTEIRRRAALAEGEAQTAQKEQK